MRRWMSVNSTEGAATAIRAGTVTGIGMGIEIGVVIASGPVELRRAVDPWGPIEPGALALMRALRDEFDPKRVLNPGRYVGGL